MLIVDLIKQEWKKSIRSRGFYKNIVANLFLGIFAVYIIVVFLFLGFSLNSILEKVSTSLTPMEIVNGAMFYLILGALTIRFLLQQLNTFNLPLYQTLPIKRSTLVNFILIKPIFAPINYFTLLVIMPFAIKSVAGYYSGIIAFRFVLSFVFIIWFDSLTAAFLKRKFGSSVFAFLAIFIVFASIAALEYFKLFSFFVVSQKCFGWIILNRFGLFIPLVAVILAFGWNKRFFYKNFYPEQFNQKLKGAKISTADFSFLNRFGIVGELISLQIKLMLRHKRTRTILLTSAIFLFYGLLFYTHHSNGDGMLFFIAVFMTGILMLMYGQWAISWDSNHFDSLMTKNIPVRSYVTANYYLMMAFNILCFVLTTPYFLFGSKIIYMHIAAFFFNSGVNVFLLLFFSTFNTKRVDLSRSSAMNYQGTTYKSFLIVLPIMFLPMLLVGILSWVASLSVALWTVSILGLTGILLRKPLITVCINQFNSRKYKLAEGFREQE